MVKTHYSGFLLASFNLWWSNIFAVLLPSFTSLESWRAVIGWWCSARAEVCLGKHGLPTLRSGYLSLEWGSLAHGSLGISALWRGDSCEPKTLSCRHCMTYPCHSLTLDAVEAITLLKITDKYRLAWLESSVYGLKCLLLYDTRDNLIFLSILVDRIWKLFINSLTLPALGCWNWHWPLRPRQAPCKGV